jgi:VanZ family protein
VGFRLAPVASVLAIAVHLWGLYRITPPPSEPWFPHADKVEHLVGFALPLLLILLTLRLRARDGRALAARTVGIVAAIFVGHAVVSEVIQGAFYSTRSGDPYDALADSCGVLLGVLLFWLIWWRRDRARGPVGAG